MRNEFRNSIMNGEIDDLLNHLCLQLQSILKDKFLGMYIGGSLATNSFNNELSDIDCYIITKNSLPTPMLHGIEAMHRESYSSQSLYAKKIEASYIPQKDLITLDPTNKRPYFNEGHFYLAHYGSNFQIELHVLRENGITLIGPALKTLIPEISTQSLKMAIHNNLNEYWEVMVDDLSKLNRSDYQVFAILTMCRTLYSLENGSIASKNEAALWAINQLEENWKPLIGQALAWRPAQEFNRVEETQQFINYVLHRSRHDTD